MFYFFVIIAPKQYAYAHKVDSKSVEYTNTRIGAATTPPEHILPSINLVELVKNKQLFDKLGIAIV